MREKRPEIGAAEEIDLYELGIKLARQWRLIVISVLLCVGVASAYALLITPSYEAKAYILPPTQNDIADFNYGRTKDSEMNRYEVKEVYDVFLRNLHAESLRREFFKDYYLPSLSEAERKGAMDSLYADFSKRLVITQVAKGGVDRYVIAVEGADPVVVKAWAERYLEQAGSIAKAEMIKNVSREAEVRARNLSQQIGTLRESGQKVREDLIVQLREALVVAQAIGLERPPIISGSLSSEVSAGMDGELTYMRGTKALEAEIRNLEGRKSDDPFIKQLRDLQVAYSFYKNLEVSPEGVEVYRLDGPIEQPDEPVKPKKAAVVVIGLLLGVVIGLLLATLRVLFLDRRALKG
ncbi:LPS O-antigen chain length determinant protein WzzB [Pseudomonas donghuensis]|uniref:LPS O-antigen chain length determinant protein WzzB n=1 Tax=Pseudomonas donghuensis TaxID=1163398 RepID=UPI0021603047|nr:Wzz/FepE/Etk N-terminal domain-containing protein [Pseudomonas donghuensis]UVL28188.1 Wzz/FepE/Etk N-terminal domain-containing protein [Pseudomonas donghuensis]